MCDICKIAKTLPKHEALRLIAQAMQQRGAASCLDEVVGELAGEPTPKVDRDAEAAWESGRRGK
jgi:hypothetical protein